MPIDEKDSVYLKKGIRP